MKTILAFAVAAAFAALSPAAFADVSCKAPKADAAVEDHSHCGGNHGAQAAGAVYKATGSVKRVDKSTGKVMIAHDPVPDLKWPAMTMQFGVADKKLLDELAAGKKIDFRFVQRGTDYVVTALY